MLKQRAFTLIELLMGLCVLTMILTALAVYFRSYNQTQTTTLMNDINDAIHIAKAEALIQNKSLLLLPLSTKNGWSTGMKLVDENKCSIIHVWQWHYANLNLTWHGFQSTHFLRFANDVHHNALNGYFLIQIKGQPSHKLTINRLGRTKST
tara:strand:- start:98 stop:550 length:453 start_codon:yes stop_codon:yes gene_type:complete